MLQGAKRVARGANPGRYVLAPAWHWAVEVKLFHFLWELFHAERPTATVAVGGASQGYSRGIGEV